MATDLKKSTSSGRENSLTSEEQQKKDDIAHEAETGKIYKANYKDKHGRTVLVMRPRCQNTKSTKGQIKYLVYCMENAISSLPAEQGQMVWLIDFHGFNMSHISFKVTRETAIVLQERYPERLGIAILYNAPKFFEPFWKLAKPFLEPKTVNKVKFFYPEDPISRKAMEDLFDMELVESAFGGKGDADFDINKYAERMKEDDKKISASLLNVVNSDPVIMESNLETSEDKVVEESSSGNADMDDNDETGEELSVHTVDEHELPPTKLPGITVST
ncbi:uncharacterized protein LOC141721659 isoform X2 [Apium graveolens]|uniref:uncharacterized protein LOC141721659 isoform X2 n=1 Tax=Apium graveolens TaxID=4045 RepID=UPI003D7BB1CD